MFIWGIRLHQTLDAPYKTIVVFSIAWQIILFLLKKVIVGFVWRGAQEIETTFGQINIQN